jgi:hypothetical protein
VPQPTPKINLSALRDALPASKDAHELAAVFGVTARTIRLYLRKYDLPRPAWYRRPQSLSLCLDCRRAWAKRTGEGGCPFIRAVWEEPAKVLEAMGSVKYRTAVDKAAGGKMLFVIEECKRFAG